MTLRTRQHQGHRSRPRHAVAALAAGAIGITLATMSPPAAQATGTWGSATYAGAGTSLWTVPTGVDIVRVTVGGGMGGALGGPNFLYPNQLTGYVRLPAGMTQLEVNVGGNGAAMDPIGRTGAGGVGGSGGAGGAGGTGNGGSAGGLSYGGAGGGGATDVRPVGQPMSAAFLVGGGSGGSGGNNTDGDNDAGGSGGIGGLAPQPGQAGAGSDGGGGGSAGTASAGPATNGGNYVGSNSGGGGGGGGYGGGGGGAAGQAWRISFNSGSGGGGGGGLSYVNPNVVTWYRESGTLTQTVYLYWLNVSGPTTASATVGEFKQTEYVAGDGMDGATWELSSGTLPPGMFLITDTGNGTAYVRGTPTTPGTFSYTLSASATYNGESQLQSSVSTTTTVAAGAASAAATTATSISFTTATLNGDIETGGRAASTIECTYWPTSNPAIAATPSSIAEGAAKTAVACNATGLTSGTSYEYQVKATIGGRTITSNTRGFTTNTAPARVTTGAATTITRTSATGNGTVSSTQAVTAIQCRVATTLNGVAAATPINANPASTSGPVTNQAVTCPFTGLSANTPYYYGVFATDTAGTATSTTFATFTTREAPPVVAGAAASDVTSSSARITATVSATNSPVTAIYCRVAPLGTPVADGTLVPATPSVADADASDLSVTCDLTQLSASTSYVARVYATDADGTGANPTVTRFTTGQARNSGGGGGGGSTPADPPDQTPTVSTSVAPAAPSARPMPVPTTPAPTWVRLLPGLARVDNLATGSAARITADGPARRTPTDAPRAVMRRLTPTVVTIRGIGSNRTVIVNIARSGADKPGWQHLSTTKAARNGSITLPPLAIASGEFVVRVTDSSGQIRYAVLSMRRG